MWPKIFKQAGSFPYFFKDYNNSNFIRLWKLNMRKFLIHNRCPLKVRSCPLITLKQIECCSFFKWRKNVRKMEGKIQVGILPRISFLGSLTTFPRQNFKWDGPFLPKFTIFTLFKNVSANELIYKTETD